MLKNRQNQLMQYFPDEYKEELARIKEAKLQAQGQSQSATGFKQNMSKSQQLDLKLQGSKRSKDQTLQNMDFFALLQATGFVKKEHSKDLKAQTTAALVKSQGISGGGGTLPMIRVHEPEERPWRIKKEKKLGDNFEVLSDSSDDN